MRNEILTTIATNHPKSMTFPAIIFCSWDSEIPLANAIVLCNFDGENCKNESIKEIDIVSTGWSAKHSCIIFNGVKLFAGNGQKPLTVKNGGPYSYGLRLAFYIPEKVRINK